MVDGVAGGEGGGEAVELVGHRALNIGRRRSSSYGKGYGGSLDDYEIHLERLELNIKHLDILGGYGAAKYYEIILERER